MFANINDELLLRLAEQEVARQEAAQGAFVFWMVVLIVWVVSCIAALLVGGNRGRAGAGFFCGFLLGPLGVIVAMFLPKGEMEAPRAPGSPVKRTRSVPIKMDPLEQWEAKERAKTVLAVPKHLQGKGLDE